MRERKREAGGRKREKVRYKKVSDWERDKEKGKLREKERYIWR